MKINLEKMMEDLKNIIEIKDKYNKNLAPFHVIQYLDGEIQIYERIIRGDYEIKD